MFAAGTATGRAIDEIEQKKIAAIASGEGGKQRDQAYVLHIPI